MSTKVKKVCVRNNDDIEIVRGTPAYIVCCDCGLVHRLRLIEGYPRRATIRISLMRKMTKEERGAGTKG